MRRPLRRGLLAAAAAWVVLAIAQPAAAGGWWSYIPLQGAELGVGERFTTARGEVLFASAEAAARAKRGEERFYAYLIPDMDWSVVEEAMSIAEPGNWWVRPETRIRVGRVEVRGGPSNLARIRVAFDVPEVEPGTYALMLCTAGCVRHLADIVPSEVTVTADPATARTARELSRVESRLEVVRSRLGQRVRELERGSREAPASEADLLEALDRATSRVRALERRVSELEGAAPALAWLVVGAAGAALLLLLLRRRRPRERPPTPPRVVEMELAAPPQELGPESEPERTPVPAA